MTGAQEMLLELLESRIEVSTVEILNVIPMTTPAKGILRLRKKLAREGRTIINRAPNGELARYSLVNIPQDGRFPINP